MLAKLLADKHYPLVFNILELGAVPLEGTPEPFFALLEFFPGSRISAFELDSALCEELNRKAPAGLRYYACPIGRAEESRTLYETMHPMCTSLYEPDERFADLYHALDVMRLSSTTTVRTVSLDTFMRENKLANFDFIKMDVQGAELDVLQGGSAALATVLAVVCEVEFVPLYKNQPLFGDVDAHMRGKGFALHKFLGLAGRVMKPLASHGTGLYPQQLMWSDALYTRDVFHLSQLAPDQLLKLAVLLDIYDSNDVALHVLRLYDQHARTQLGASYLELLTATGLWAQKQPRPQ